MDGGKRKWEGRGEGERERERKRKRIEYRRERYIEIREVVDRYIEEILKDYWKG